MGRTPCGGKARGELCQNGDATYWTAPLAMAASDREIITLADGAPRAFTAANFSDLSRAQQLGLLGCGADTGDAWSGDKAYCNAGVDLARTIRNNSSLRRTASIICVATPAKRPVPPDGFRERDGHWLGDIIGSNALVVTAPKRMFYDADY
jgi:hypothetical protein